MRALRRSRSSRATGYELLYFRGLVGTVPALLTPDISQSFPSAQFVAYFLLHGSVMGAWAVATFGLRLRLDRGAALRAFGLTNVYALAVAVFDGATGASYLYLRRKPEALTPLDWLGPWPVYRVVTDVLILALFLLLERPARARSSQAGAR